MTTRIWRTLDKFDLQSLANDQLDTEPGDEVSLEVKANPPQCDVFATWNDSEVYLCSTNYGGQIEEINPRFAEYFS
jgi:hypothetical protein